MNPLILLAAVSLLIAAPGSDASEQPGDREIDVRDQSTVGAFSGTIGAYYSIQHYRQDSFSEDGVPVPLKDEKLATSFFQADYRSPEYYGLGMSAGLTGYSYLDREGQEESIRKDNDHFIIHDLSLRYTVSATSLVAGRQEFPHATFLDKYYEAVSLTARETKNVVIFLAAVRKSAEADIDAFLDFRDIDSEHPGAANVLYAAEVTVTGIPESLRATLYYYHQNKLFTLYGSHAEVFQELPHGGFGVELDSYYTEEDGANGLTDEAGNAGDGNIYHVALTGEFENLSLSLGYLKADQDVGAREGGLIDDAFNPFDEGDNVYAPAAETWYGGLAYGPGNILLEFVYGSSRYRGNGRRFTDREMDIRTEAHLWDKITVEARYIRVDSDGPEGRYAKFEIELTYALF